MYINPQPCHYLPRWAFKLPKAGPYGQGSASVNVLGQSVPTDSCQGNYKKSVGLPTSGNTFHPKRQFFKEGKRKYKWNFVRLPNQNVHIQNELNLPHGHQTSAFEWNLPLPPNFVWHSTQVPNQNYLDIYHSKVGGKSCSWDFHSASSASTPSCHVPS